MESLLYSNSNVIKGKMLMEKPTYDLSRHRGSDEDSIAFLNSPVKNFFSGFVKFKYASFKSYLKSVILNAVIDIERVIKGVFNCDIFMKNAQYEMLKQMFPNGMEIFGVESQEDVVNVARFLETLRNATAHAISSAEDNQVFKTSFKNLNNQKKFNEQIRYESHGHLTMAGLFFIFLNFLREESIENVVKEESLFAFITCGKRSKDNGALFVLEISKVNLEVPIRTNEGKTVLSAICGDYFNQDEEKIDISIGTEENPSYCVKGNYSNGELIINKGSLAKTYYIDNYCLKIEEEKLFIELANKFPPMVLVDLLYLLEIKTFNKDAYNLINRNYEKVYSKLNYPKFYIDKNIGTLLLPKSNSDYRLTCSIVVNSITYIMNNIEDYLSDHSIFKAPDSYSRLSSALRAAGVPDKERNNACVLRNFAMHGYTFGEYIIIGDNYYQFTLEFTIKTLKDLVLVFKQINKTAYRVFATSISYRFVERLCAAKYRKAIEVTKALITDIKNSTLLNDLGIKNNFINNSFYDVRDLNELNSLCDGSTLILEVIVPGLSNKIYFYNSERELLDSFIKDYGYAIEKEIAEGVIKTIYLA